MKDYEIIRSARRTMALEITRDGRVLVRAPLGVSEARIAAFVSEHQTWLAEHLARREARLAAAPPPRTKEEIEALKARARQVIPPKVALWAERTGLHPTGVRITAARTRFGSCNTQNSLCFSCFLLDQPEAVIDLVVVHELCHILEKNHGPGFYALMDRFLPDHRERRAMIR